MAELRWIVMGTGLIAEKVTPLLARSPGCRVVGVASRNLDRASRFAARHNLEHTFTYDDLVPNPVGSAAPAHAHADAVYCTLPNRLHPAWSLRLLESGFHVLCEKPLCWRRDDAEQLFAAAQRTGRLLVEGFMYLHHPQTEALRTIAGDGDALGVSPIGRVHRIEAFFESDMKAANREATRYSHRLAGGAVLDLGCYPISFVRTMLSRPLGAMQIQGAVADPLPGETEGVDERVEVEGLATCSPQAPAAPGGPGQVSFRLVCRIDRVGSRCVRLIGTHGSVSTDWPWAPDPERAELVVHRDASHPRGPGVETIAIEHGGDKFILQFAAFAAAVRGDRAPYPSPAWSIDQAGAIERILSGVGVDFGPGLAPSRT